MVKKLLEFNPYFRVSASDFVKNPYFDFDRVSACENLKPAKICLPFDHADSYDYENFKDLEFKTMDELRQAVY